MTNAATRLLFVGNSFIFRNDLPALVQQLAPVPLETQTVVAGGASLRQHINSGAVKAALANAKWNYVILQEQSTLPIKNPARFAANVRELHELISTHGATTALYQTWARQNAPETQQPLSAAYADLARELGVLLIPVGDAWHSALRENPKAPLFDADGSHPSLAGSQLAASVFAQTLWKSN